MEELSKHGELGRAAMKAGMDRKTAAKYRDAGQLPSQMKQERTWRTRPDPFEEDWPAIVERLADAPELEAKTLFELLVEKQPGRYEEGQLRTLQRKVHQWRATSGPEQMVFFPQVHRPGEAAQTDFTWGTELGIKIAGEPFAHMICHVVLPYSNWEWGTVCQSESMLALRRGLQAALFRLGRRPKVHQTDNSTAATHDLRTGKRGFNEEYLAVMRHFDLEPRTIEVGESNQNGDVEALNGALKRRLKQHLLVRGHSDFESVGAYETWLQGVMEKANRLRSRRITEEMEAMRPLEVERLAEYAEIKVTVSSWSTIRVLHNTYSVPSRLMGEEVRVRIFEDRMEVAFGGLTQMEVERLTGRNGHRINYRHIIWSLVQKPGAFARYRYREELFPTLAFRRAYDALRAGRSEWKADLEYLRVLHLAASMMESEVEAAVLLLLEAGKEPTREEIRAILDPGRPEHPSMAAPKVDLSSYDALLAMRQEVAL
jgi:hypothetical protein